MFVLFECKKVQFVTQKIIWGLKNEYFPNVFDQNMSIENLNSMLSEARSIFF